MTKKTRKRVGLREAKKIFHKRSLRSQVADRKKTAKRVVNHRGKDSWRWKENPNLFDIRMVDTKMKIPKKIVGEDIFIPFGSAKTQRQAKEYKRNITASFSPKLFLATGEKIEDFGKKASVKVIYRKKQGKKGYQLYVTQKKGIRFAFPHPIIVESKKKKGGWF